MALSRKQKCVLVVSGKPLTMTRRKCEELRKTTWFMYAIGMINTLPLQLPEVHREDKD